MEVSLRYLEFEPAFRWLQVEELVESLGPGVFEVTLSHLLMLSFPLAFGLLSSTSQNASDVSHLSFSCAVFPLPLII